MQRANTGLQLTTHLSRITRLGGKQEFAFNGVGTTPKSRFSFPAVSVGDDVNHCVRNLRGMIMR